MTTIARIQAQNIKGRSFDHDLAGLTAIVGRNKTGKSSIRDAITLALLGYSPTLGRKPAATMQLMTTGARMLDIQATYENGTKTNRRWESTGKSNKTIPVVGVDWAEDVSEIQFDFEQFVKAKPTERQRILEGLMDSTADESDIADTRKKIAESGLDVKIQFADGQPVEGWIQKLEAEAADEVKGKKQERATAAATQLQLQATAEEVTFDEAALKNTVAQLATAQENYGAAKSINDALQQRIQDSPDKPEGKPVTQDMINHAREMHKMHAHKLFELKERDAAHKAAKREVEAILQPFPDTVAAVVHADIDFPIDLSEQQKAAAQADRNASTDVTLARQKATRADRDLTELKAKIEQLKGAHQCPTCGTEGDTFHQSVDEVFAKDLQRLGEEALTAQKDQNGAEAVQHQTFQELQRLTLMMTQRQEHERFLAQARAEKILTNAPEVQAAEMKTAENYEKDTANLLAGLETNLAEWSEWNSYQHPTPEEITQAAAKFRDAKQLVESLQAGKDAMDIQRGAYEQSLADIRRLKELAQQVETLDGQIAAGAKLIAWVKAKSLEVTTKAMLPLLSVCEVVLAGLIDGKLAVVGTDIGIEGPLGFRALEVISGMEAVAISAALQVALASKSALRIVIIDELARVDAHYMEIIVKNFRAAIDGNLVDQVILISHFPVDASVVDEIITTD